MKELIKLTITQVNQLLKKREISAVELTEACLDRAREVSGLNAYIELTADLALHQAQGADARLKSGQGGAIDGVPIGVKDLFCTNGVQTTSGSAMLKGFVPQYESTVTSKLFAAGGIMIGKTNMDEFAMGSANATSHFGPVISPWKRRGDQADLVPGGSSGGSAAAVASYSCFGALGSDTGGSIRQPAAFSGIVGMKPTYGRCSRLGMIAFASSLDQAGVLTRSVSDAALMMQVIAGHDPQDSTSSALAVPDFSAKLSNGVKGLRVGVPKEYWLEDMPEEIAMLWRQGIDWLREAGAEVVDISLPNTEHALPTYYVIAPAEASSNLARYDGVRYGIRVCGENTTLDQMYEDTRAAGFGTEVKRRIMIGTYMLSSGFYDAYYTRAQRIRRLISDDFNAAFKNVDVILTPTTPNTAFALSDNTNDPITMYLMDIFTVTVNLAGLPAISVPSGIAANGLPLGLQLIGKAFDETTLFGAAAALEKAAQFTYL